MRAATRLGDTCTGHECFPPRVNDQGSPNVFINSKAAHRQGDHWVTHVCGKNSHDSVAQTGSGTVNINSVQAMRIGDPIACGSIVAQGSPDVFIGG